MPAVWEEILDAMIFYNFSAWAKGEREDEI